MNEWAALYCRLSVEDEYKKGESESIQNQKLLLENYAKSKGWNIYQIYCDEDYSGLDDTRPQFCQMLLDAQKGMFQIIVCKTQSRFTRNMETAERYLHHYFLLWGIRFVTIVDHVDTAIEGNKKARQINGLVNEWYCEEISENIRTVFKRKMELGQFLGPYACYGYQKSKGDRHKLEIDDTCALVVKKIFELYESGKSCRQIACCLTAKKIITPWEYKKQKGLDCNRRNVKYTMQWSANTISKILKNRMYTGCMVQGKEKKLSYKSKKVVTVPPQQWIVVENTHEAIISKEQFEAVQKRMAEKNKNKKNI